MRQPSRGPFGVWNLLSDGSWHSYFMCGTLALMLSWVLTGCRLGNRVENPPSKIVNPVGIEGAFSTSAVRIQTSVLKTSTGLQTYADAPLSTIPKALQEVFSDPIGILLQNQATGQAAIFSPFATPDSNGKVPGLPVFFNYSDRSFSLDRWFDPIPFWFDTLCTQTDNTVVVDGSLNTKNAGEMVNGWTVFGRAAFQYQNYSFLDGNCTATLQAIQDCYQDATQCRGSTPAHNLSEQNFWKSFYSPYIQAGLITDQEITDVKAMAYGIYYQ